MLRLNRRGPMLRFRFAIYPPAGPELPWLAVTLDRDKVVDFFACPSKDAAEKVSDSMKARWTAKSGPSHA